MQKCKDGLARKVWIFKLKLVNGYNIPKFDKSVIQQNTEQKEKKVKKFSNEDIKNKAKEKYLI